MLFSLGRSNVMLHCIFYDTSPFPQSVEVDAFDRKINITFNDS
ncbi:hypothetical protein PORCRE_1952 [Porphyromonas crevioricanis JCM 15906]|uniref:Uncharacterized protein n=1 Tax=Porphyromonas crevioricanis JCM 15906 TaxID=1305617 RepID=T1CSS5_9PORP|nr:hypothetical protein PORCRE_1952 [Porphyromonas crevioricanis JCM 15906]